MSNIEEIVNESKKPGVFNIVDAVKNRAYPTDEVEIFIDEDVAFHVAELNEAIEKIAGDLDKAGLAKKEVDAILKRRDKIMADREKLIKEMGDTKYLFHLKGISEDRKSVV